jgi:hypothetical protein
LGADVIVAVRDMAVLVLCGASYTTALDGALQAVPTAYSIGFRAVLELLAFRILNDIGISRQTEPPQPLQQS